MSTPRLKDDSGLQSYLARIGEHRLLTAEEEIALAQRRKAGDASAVEELITNNLKLVVFIAWKFRWLGMPIEDLIAAGNQGLMRAAERFDDRGLSRFSHYAGFWIKQCIRREAGNNARLVRIPIGNHKAMWVMTEKVHELHEALGRAPSDEELADACELPLSKVSALRQVLAAPLSLQAEVGGEGSASGGHVTTFEDVIAAEGPDASELCETHSNHDDVSELLAALEPRERMVIEARFGIGCDPLTLEETGIIFGVTRERIRQIQNKVIKKLRRRLEKKSKVAA